ncbi:hypothetical protein DPMN_121790 [Dreissena polymorpha]|uniref:Uncharacterized protein n=1 Tax=Dreissena polymorpha TaxID=45954 RepID=A0A9D4GR93_DREPO|nr:hypothetical protein DPMN_121790 [Dreissena polymorpha]
MVTYDKGPPRDLGPNKEDKREIGLAHNEYAAGLSDLDTSSVKYLHLKLYISMVN